MKVLCVATHPDDEIIGVGGTLARHVHQDDEVYVLILSEGSPSRYEQMTTDVEERIEERRESSRKACASLGIDTVEFRGFPDNKLDMVPLLEVVKAIERKIEAYEPDTIYTHHYGDLNESHKITCSAVVTAARPLPHSNVDKILAFETLSTSEWSLPHSSNSFQPTTFVDISDQLEEKLDALSQHREELREHPHPRNRANVHRNAKLWGAKAGISAAEPFELIREIV